MKRIGLTGGIGSGKSTVAALLADKGAVVIDADQVARAVVAPGTPGLAAVIERFGESVRAPDGSLDRRALGAIVFADPEERAALEAITHPLIRARTAELMAAAGQDAVIVHDIPLLVETGVADAYDTVLLVDASEETRIQRLVTHRGMTPEEARARIAAQATREERLAVADVVVTNEGDETQLAHQIEQMWPTLRASGEDRPGA